jgi:hypothetical protein
VSIANGETPSASGQDAHVIREMIRHENELMNHRISWFNALQGLLFAALAFSWDKANAAGLVYMFCALGMLLSLSTFYSLEASLLAISRLCQWWDTNRANDYHGPDVIGRRPDQSSLPPFRPYVLFPVAFGLCWVWIAVWRAC